MQNFRDATYNYKSVFYKCWSEHLRSSVGPVLVTSSLILATGCATTDVGRQPYQQSYSAEAQKPNLSIALVGTWSDTPNGTQSAGTIVIRSNMTFEYSDMLGADNFGDVRITSNDHFQLILKTGKVAEFDVRGNTIVTPENGLGLPGGVFYHTSQ